MMALEDAGYPAIFEDGTGDSDGDIEGTAGLDGY